MKKRKYKTQNSIRKTKHEAVGVLLCALGLFSALSIYFPQNTGVVGPMFRSLQMGLFGILAYVLPLAILIIGIMVIVSYRKTLHTTKLIFTLLFILLLMSFVHLFYFYAMDWTSFSNLLRSSYMLGSEGLGTGIFSVPLAYGAYALFGLSGAYILMFGLIIADILLLTNLSLKKLGFGLIKHIKPKFATKPSKQSDKEIPSKDSKTFVGELILEEQKNPVNLKPLRQAFERSETTDVEDIKIFDFQKEHPHAQPANLEQIIPIPIRSKASPDEIPEVLDMSLEGYQQVVLPYMIPPISLLNEPVVKKGGPNQEKLVLQTAKLLEETLSSFGVSAKVVQISRGPVITRYELQPASGVKVNRIKNLSDDIALNLAAQGVRIEAPIPGKAVIGVEVPNKDIAPVMLREVMDTEAYASYPSKVPFALGKDIAGKNIITDITKMPHLLIAGATGSGKSVCINTLILSILYKSTPEEVKLIMIDPKVVELSNYNGIPHLMVPVVTDPKKAAGALNWAVQEMTSRYKLFADKGARDIERYNEQLDELGDTRLPQIVVIIDELADLMMVAPGDVEDAICRLAQMARAAGIHLVIATQRPSVDVITGVIKANIPSRIAFAVSSQTDSRTILDMGGAEKLLGKGDMLFYPSGSGKPIRVQGAFISEKEVESVVSCIKNQNTAPKYNEDVLEEIAVDGELSDDDGVDELLADAIEVVIDAGQASISMIQRRLRVGYARAARLIDEMEKRGLVSGFNGSKTRNVLISKEEFEQQYKN